MKNKAQKNKWRKPVGLFLAALVTATTIFGQPISASAATNDGKPWVNYSLQENIAQVEKTDVKDDFYLAVNYEWLKDAKLQAGTASNSTFYEVSENVRENAKKILKDSSIKGHDAKLIRTYYNDYMDWDARNKAGVKPLKPTVKAIKSISSMKELSDLICSFDDVSMGVPTLIGIGNTTSLSDSSKYITAIGGSGLLLGDAAEYSKRTELGDRYYKAYRKLAVTMLKRLGYSSKEANAMFKRVIQFEGQLAEATYTSAEMMDPSYLQRINNEKSSKQLMKMMKNFPLKRYVKAMGYGNAKKFLVENPAYIAKVDKLYTKKNLENMKEYMLVHYVVGMTGMLDRKAYDLALEANQTISGADGKRPDEDYAYATVVNALSVPMQKVYLQQNNAAEKKERITKLCNKIIAEYREKLKETDWLSAQTKEKAIEKLDAITLNVIGPDKWEDYSDLKLKGKSYFEDTMILTNYYTKKNQKLTNKTVDKTEWKLNTLETNAYYNFLDNSVNILLGILGGDIYNDDMTDEEMYAGIGMIIGHEISHAFDPTGSQFDAQGNMVNWWSTEDYAQFEARKGKVIKYFDQIVSFNGTNANGTGVQGEAIADITSMDCMLRLAKQKKNFDYEKFFKHYAVLWKECYTPEYGYYCLTQDSHPLTYLRTNVVVQQFEEFYQTFGVKPGDNMYLAPENRLTVW